MDTKDFVENRNVLKEDFGWEVPVELVPLPSKGVLYHPETPLYKKEALKIKAMTAREEDILSSQALIKEGTVLDHLIDSCLVEKGVDSKLLTIGDRNALMISIRITGYGPEYPVNSTCTHCGHSNDIVIDLGSLAIKRLEIEPVAKGENLFEFQLPVTKKTVHFKYTTMKDEREYATRSKQMKKHLKDFFNSSITDSLDMTIQSIDGITDKNKLKHFIVNMPAFDSRALRTFIRENEPGMDMTWQYDCANCQKENKIAMPITAEFFWPGT